MENTDIHVHSAQAQWPAAFTATSAPYFWAQCSCGWAGPTVKHLATAERHADDHLIECSDG